MCGGIGHVISYELPQVEVARISYCVHTLAMWEDMSCVTQPYNVPGLICGKGRQVCVCSKYYSVMPQFFTHP